jgi:serine/threonine-protein kinase HipA
LYCYKDLNEGEHDFHVRCAWKFFGTTTAPTMDYTRKDMDRLAEQIIRSQTTLTGVQPKLSLNLQKHEGSQRLTVVGLWGAYIFKPQTAGYPELPENEDLTMHLAEIAGINTAKHSLIRLADNSLGYLTRRMDRDEKGNKLAMEDFCQLTERQTEYKYRSSYEQIAKTIAKFSSVPGLDLVNFYEMVMFCWLTGNNDMHLKNFSLLSQKRGEYELSPAYDLLNVAIANPNDKEELTLTLNGKKSRITRNDFVEAAGKSGVSEVIVKRLISNFEKCVPAWVQKIDVSFLSDEMKEKYVELVYDRIGRIME